LRHVRKARCRHMKLKVRDAESACMLPEASNTFSFTQRSTWTGLRSQCYRCPRVLDFCAGESTADVLCWGANHLQPVHTTRMNERVQRWTAGTSSTYSYNSALQTPSALAAHRQTRLTYNVYADPPLETLKMLTVLRLTSGLSSLNTKHKSEEHIVHRHPSYLLCQSSVLIKTNPSI